MLGVVLALTPSQWGDSLKEWFDALSDAWRIVVPFALGTFAGFGLHAYVRISSEADGLELLNADDYEPKFRERLAAREFSQVKVFGYTGEVFLNDLIEYDDRYNGNLELRILNRSWTSEALEEERHNAALDPGTRPWKKADAIRRLGETNENEWSHSLRRTFKYYDHSPCIKGLILCAAGGERELFLTFHRWSEKPENGGSPHKGKGMSVLYVCGNNAVQRDFIALVESQFDREWSESASFERVVTASSLPPK